MASSDGQAGGALVVERGDTFRIHTDVYKRQEIFDREMREIFGSTWVYLFHESQLAGPGEYRTTVMGDQPVIVSRGDDGAIRAYLNVCRHRGSVVCRVEHGVANTFRCPYHGWIYSNEGGDLIGIPQRKQGYPDSFGKDEDLGLLQVPRVESYRGLIFGSLNPSVPPLTEHLGRACHYIDLWADQSLTGSMVAADHPHQYSYRSNWKLQAENGSDGYHGNYVHESFFKVREQFDDVPVKATRDFREAGCTRSFDNGHCLLERPGNEITQTSQSKYVQELIDLHGEERAQEILRQRNILIFPNVYLFNASIRTIVPRAIDYTTVVSAFVELQGVEPDFNHRRLKVYQRFFGTAGFGSPDDLEIFEAVGTGVKTSLDWLVLERDLGNEQREGEEIVGHSTAETPQRAIYRQWARLMGAGQLDGAARAEQVEA